MQDARKCKVISYTNGTREGTFLGWGQGYWSDEANAMHPRTFAIVELEDGRVIEAAPSDLQFTGPRTAQEAIERAVADMTKTGL